MLKQSQRHARCALATLTLSAATLNCTMSGVVSAWHAGQDQPHDVLSSVGLSRAAALPEGGRNEAKHPGSLQSTDVSLLLALRYAYGMHLKQVCTACQSDGFEQQLAFYAP